LGIVTWPLVVIVVGTYTSGNTFERESITLQVGFQGFLALRAGGRP
jgi:hypothetical protein